MANKLIFPFFLTLLFYIDLFAYDYHLKPLKVTDGVYCFFGVLEEPNKKNGGNISNSCYIDNGNSYSIVDTGATYQYAKQSYEAITKMYGIKPIENIFITHTHDDHHLGNIFYKDLAKHIIGSKKLEEQLNSDRMKNSISKEAYEGTKLLLPNIRISSNKEDFGDIEAITLENQAHSTSDIVYLSKSKRVLFVGDLVFNDRILSLRDGSLNGWIKSLEKIEKIDFDYMVSGHGYDTSKNAHLVTKEYLIKLKKEVKKAMSEDKEIEEVAKTIEFNEYKKFNLYNELHSKNLFKAYQLLEWEE